MAKPILIVRIPSKARDTMNDELQQRMKTVLNESVPDYNKIVMFTSDVESVQFEVLNVQDYPQISFDELKQKLDKYL